MKRGRRRSAIWRKYHAAFFINSLVELRPCLFPDLIQPRLEVLNRFMFVHPEQFVRKVARTPKIGLGLIEAAIREEVLKAIPTGHYVTDRTSGCQVTVAAIARKHTVPTKL